MAENKPIPPHVQQQIADAGKSLSDKGIQISDVKDTDPTQWTKYGGPDKVPEPQKVEPVVPDQPQPEH